MKVIIIASGPSAADFSADWIPKGWKSITVCSAWKLLPDADHHYAGDLDWWKNYYSECNSTGTRWTWDVTAASKYGLNLIKRKEGRGMCVLPGYTHHGGNSGFQAINLAYHLGARKIALYGYDMSRKNGAHFHGDHKPGMLNAPDNHIQSWKKHMRYMARDCERLGVNVVNCSAYTELDCFHRLPIGELS